MKADDVLSRGNYFGDYELARMFARDYEKHHPEGGVIHQFRVKQPLTLLAMDEWQTQLALRVNRPMLLPNHEDRLRVRAAYPRRLNSDGKVTRFYGSPNDVPMAHALCQVAHVDGFATLRMLVDHDPQHRWITSPDFDYDAPDQLRPEEFELVVPEELYCCRPHGRRWWFF